MKIPDTSLPKPKRRKKTPRKIIKDRLEKLSKRIVYLRDDYTCQKCGKRDGRDYQASHVIPVSAGNKLAWEPLNMKVLCHHCHLNWWHKNPMEAAAWFSEAFPDRWEYLQRNRGIKKFTLTELEELEESLKGQLDGME